jgi:hypothetical protein
MLVVRVEMHHARTNEITELARAYICNEGTSDDPKRGNYRIRVCRKGRFDLRSALAGQVARRGLVSNYPRQAYNVWRLVARALLAAFPEEGGRRV